MSQHMSSGKCHFSLIAGVQDVFLKILDLVGPTGRAVARCVCRRWRETVERSSAKIGFIPEGVVENPRLLRWVLKFYPPPWKLHQSLYLTAAERGQRACFGLLMRFDVVSMNSFECAIAAAGRGDLKLLKMIEYDHEWRRPVMISRRPLPVSQPPRITFQTSGVAPKMLRVPWQPSQLSWAGDCCIAAAREGHIEILRHFIQDTWPCCPEPGLRWAAITEACKGGHDATVAWLLHPDRPNIEEVL